MPRQREFDREEVLDRAVDVFWERGYEATSVQDLVDAMGIQRGSLYNTFGDKRTLFLAALKRYEQVQVSRVVEVLKRPGPVRDTIRSVLEGVVRDEAGCAVRRGCLAVNTAVELGCLDPNVAARATAALRRVEDAFEQALRRAQEKGEIERTLDVRALARFFTSSLQGLRVMSKAGAEQGELRDVAEVTLRALG
jgi:TetR/AcrR family transcriptional repressor of nem operon